MTRSVARRRRAEEPQPALTLLPFGGSGPLRADDSAAAKDRRRGLKSDQIKSKHRPSPPDFPPPWRRSGNGDCVAAEGDSDDPGKRYLSHKRIC